MATRSRARLGCGAPGGIGPRHGEDHPIAHGLGDLREILGRRAGSSLNDQFNRLRRLPSVFTA